MTDFKSRRHLAMMLLPEVTNDYDNLHEMLINRSNLLAESFESITGAEIAALHCPMHIGFINEEATGPGVYVNGSCWCAKLYSILKMPYSLLAQLTEEDSFLTHILFQTKKSESYSLRA
ncbi:E3 ubiquitin protein ligase UPL5-like protein [Tanacetum coccineum]